MSSETSRMSCFLFYIQMIYNRAMTPNVTMILTSLEYLYAAKWDLLLVLPMWRTASCLPFRGTYWNFALFRNCLKKVTSRRWIIIHFWVIGVKATIESSVKHTWWTNQEEKRTNHRSLWYPTNYSLLGYVACKSRKWWLVVKTIPDYFCFRQKASVVGIPAGGCQIESPVLLSGLPAVARVWRASATFTASSSAMLPLRPVGRSVWQHPFSRKEATAPTLWMMSALRCAF